MRQTPNKKEWYRSCRISFLPSPSMWLAPLFFATHSAAFPPHQVGFTSLQLKKCIPLFGSTKGGNAEDQQMQRSTTTKNESSRVGPEKIPAFPRDAYPLLKDEADVKHNFISFIDQSIFSSYSQTVRLVEPRLYARQEQFLAENASLPPTIEDVAEPASFYGKFATLFAWNGIPARAVVGCLSYLIFPYIVAFLETETSSVEANDLVTLVTTFLPGISIVLGTYFSLTISILYDRFAKMQETVSQEAGLLELTCNNLLLLFHDDQEAAVEGVQCIADQIRTMVFDSRGKETMGIIYTDPYARIVRLLKNKGGSRDPQICGDIHGVLKDLFMLRSKRMNFESLALAPTHFDVMTFLCGMLLAGFALGTVATAQTDGVPLPLASFLFSALVVVYTIFYETAFDLNRPFDGIYQIRRSGAAMHFLHIKHLISSDPLVAGLVNFEQVLGDDDENVIATCDDECKQRKAEIWYN